MNTLKNVGSDRLDHKPPLASTIMRSFSATAGKSNYPHSGKYWW